MLKNFEQMKEMLRAKPVKRRVAVAAAQDEHTLQAVVAAARDGLVTPVGNCLPVWNSTPGRRRS